MKILSVKNTQANANTPQLKQNISMNPTVLANNTTGDKFTPNIVFGMARVKISEASESALTKRLGEINKKLQMHLDGIKRQRLSQEASEIEARIQQLTSRSERDSEGVATWDPASFAADHPYD